MRNAFLLFAALLLSATHLHAQVLYGSIVGTVIDATNAPVPEAATEVTNAGTHETRHAITGTTGEFAFPALPAGTYSVTISKAGFQTFTERDIQVATDQVVRVNASLAVGTVSETVQVTADTAVMQTDSAQVQTEVESKTLEEIPIPVNRNFESLLITVPGITPPENANSNAANPSRGLTFSSNGTIRVANNIRIDGASSNNPWLPYLAAYIPSADAIEQVSVVTNSFDASQGLVGGAAVNVHVKSGTDQLHGSLYYFTQNGALAARPFFLASNQSNPKYINNDFGATLGGPLIKDKLFYFASFEGNYFREFASVLTTVSTAPQRVGNFTGLGTIYDPATGNAATAVGRTQFPGNIIPTSRLDPIAVKIEQSIPLPNQGGTSNNYYGSGDYSIDRDTTDAKLDYRATANLSLAARLGWLRYDQVNPPAFGDNGPAVSSAGGRAGHAFGDVYSTTFSGTYLARSNFIVDSHFNASLMGTNSEPLDAGTNVGLNLGIPGTNGSGRQYSGWPWFNISDYGTVGNAGNSGGGLIYYNDDSYQYSLNATWVKGNHNVRFGGEIDRMRLHHVDDSASLAGEFVFGGGPTGLPGKSTGQYNNYSSFLLGLPTTISKDLLPFDNGAITENMWLFSLYAQDQWRASSRLTVNFGTAWNYFPVGTRDSRGVERYNFNTNQLELCGVAGNPGNCGIDVQKLDFSPSLGLAFRVSDTLVIRSGFGLNFDPSPLAYNRDLFPNYPEDLTLTLNGTGVNSSYIPAGSFETGIPTIQPPDITKGYIQLPAQYGITTLSQNPKRDYVLSWNFSLQKQLPWGFVGQTGYVATRGIDVPQEVNLNYQHLGGGTPSQIYNQLFGTTQTLYLIENQNHTSYDSVQSRLSRRFSHGMMLNLAYTFSKNMGLCCNDLGDQPLAIAVPQYINLTRALMPFDRANSLAISGVLELPFGKGKPWLSHGRVANMLAGGWQLSGLVTLQSGKPFNVTASATSLNASGNTQRADQVLPDVAVLGGVGPGQHYYDTKAYAAPTGARFGTSGYDTLRAPRDFNSDVTISRWFNLTEHWRMQFRAEAFNLTNTPHFSAPSGDFSSSGFMQITSTLGTGREGIDQRVLRLALKIMF